MKTTKINEEEIEIITEQKTRIKKEDLIKQKESIEDLLKTFD